MDPRFAFKLDSQLVNDHFQSWRRRPDLLQYSHTQALPSPAVTRSSLYDQFLAPASDSTSSTSSSLSTAPLSRLHTHLLGRHNFLSTCGDVHNSVPLLADSAGSSATLFLFLAADRWVYGSKIRHLLSTPGEAGGDASLVTRRLLGPLPAARHACADARACAGAPSPAPVLSDTPLPPSFLLLERTGSGSQAQLPGSPIVAVSPGDGSLHIVGLQGIEPAAADPLQHWYKVRFPQATPHASADAGADGHLAVPTAVAPFVLLNAWASPVSPAGATSFSQSSSSTSQPPTIQCVGWRVACVESQARQGLDPTPSQSEVFIWTLRRGPASGDECEYRVEAEAVLAYGYGPPVVSSVDPELDVVSLCMEMVDGGPGRREDAVTEDHPSGGLGGEAPLAGHAYGSAMAMAMEWDEDSDDDGADVAMGGAGDEAGGQLRLLQVRCAAGSAVEVQVDVALGHSSALAGRVAPLAPAAAAAAPTRPQPRPLGWVGLSEDVHCAVAALHRLPLAHRGDGAEELEDQWEEMGRADVALCAQHVRSVPALAYILRGKPRRLFVLLAAEGQAAAVVEDDGQVALYEAPQDLQALHGGHIVVQAAEEVRGEGCVLGAHLLETSPAHLALLLLSASHATLLVFRRTELPPEPSCEPATPEVSCERTPQGDGSALSMSGIEDMDDDADAATARGEVGSNNDGAVDPQNDVVKGLLEAAYAWKKDQDS